jgi:CheY-like chemotaxis protein
MDAISQQKREYDRTSHIMIVDDDQTLLKFFKIHLNKFFSHVVVVKNAREAIDEMGKKEFDLVLSDIKMPRTDGVQLLKKIRNTNASIPVFLISGAVITDEQQQIVDETADGFLRKPFTIEEIQEFIQDGMTKRGILKELSDVCKDNKVLLSLIKGKSKPARLKKPADVKRATELLQKLAG